jgi:hypothetical protein
LATIFTLAGLAPPSAMSNEICRFSHDDQHDRRRDQEFDERESGLVGGPNRESFFEASFFESSIVDGSGEGTWGSHVALAP